MVSLRQVVPPFAAARELIGQVTRSVRASLPAGSIGQLIVLAHAPEFDTDRLDVEMGYLLKASPVAAPPAPLTIRELPAVQTMATCVRVGLPEDAHLVTAKIGQFVEAKGYQLAGASRELFLEPPRPDRMQEAVVEMQYPVARAH